jgi:hypothetical protein
LRFVGSELVEQRERILIATGQDLRAQGRGAGCDEALLLEQNVVHFDDHQEWDLEAVDPALFSTEEAQINELLKNVPDTIGTEAVGDGDSVGSGSFFVRRKFRIRPFSDLEHNPFLYLEFWRGTGVP